MNTSNIYSFIILAGILFSTGCEKNDDTIYNPQSLTIVPDTVIYISSFPTNLEVKLGKSVRILNAGTTFKFYSIISDDRQNVNNEIVGNAKIILYVDYASFQKYVELNTNEVPGQYTLENGLHYAILLKDVLKADSSYKIVFQFNEYKYW